MSHKDADSSKVLDDYGDYDKNSDKTNVYQEGVRMLDESLENGDISQKEAVNMFKMFAERCK